MPQFQVRVFTQCAVPGMTPDKDNALTQLPKRMLYEHPPFMAQLLARAGVVTVEASTSDLGALAMSAARSVLPPGFDLDLVPQVYTHREVEGTYVKSLAAETGNYVFIVGKPAPEGVVPLITQQTMSSLKVMSANGPTPVVVEYRCHLVVTAL